MILNYGFPVSVPIDQFNMEGKRAFIRFLTFKFFNHKKNITKKPIELIVQKSDKRYAVCGCKREFPPAPASYNQFALAKPESD